MNLLTQSLIKLLLIELDKKEAKKLSLKYHSYRQSLYGIKKANKMYFLQKINHTHHYLNQMKK